MVFLELGIQINDAIEYWGKQLCVGDAGVKQLISDISKALLRADVNIKLVKKLKENLEKRTSFYDVPPGTNKRKLIKRIIIEELTSLLDPGAQSYELVKGKTNIILFVGT